MYNCVNISVLDGSDIMYTYHRNRAHITYSGTDNGNIFVFWSIIYLCTLDSSELEV